MKDYQNNEVYTTACYFIMTENCNLRCVYCFEKDTRAVVKKKIDLPSAHKMIDFLFDQAIAENNPNRPVDITFFGGEPMLALDECTDLLDYACAKRDETGKEVQFLIITNATVYNTRVEKFLQHWYDRCGNVMIQLSIDGIPEIQNANRPCANKKLKSSDLVEENVVKYQKWIKDHNLPWDRLFVHCVVSKTSLPRLYDCYEYFAKKLNIRFEFAWVFEDAWNDDDIGILDNEMDRVIADMSTYASNIHLYPWKRFDKCVGCGSGKGMLSMDTEGNIYPCHRFFFYSLDSRKEMYLGNINDEVPINEEIRKQFMELDPATVSDDPCQVCIAVNYENTGRIDKLPNKYGVEFMKILNKYYDIFVGIVERRMMAMNIRDLNNRCNNLERTVITLASILKDKFNIPDDVLPIKNGRTNANVRSNTSNGGNFNGYNNGNNGNKCNGGCKEKEKCEDCK